MKLFSSVELMSSNSHNSCQETLIPAQCLRYIQIRMIALPLASSVDLFLGPDRCEVLL